MISVSPRASRRSAARLGPVGVDPQAASGLKLGVRPAAAGLDQAGDVTLRLQADRVAGGQPARDIARVRQRRDVVDRRKGDVQEDPCPLEHARRARLPRRRHEMGTVDPDRLAAADQRCQHPRQPGVHREVTVEVAAAPVHLVRAAAEQRPKRLGRLAEAVVVTLRLGQRADRRGPEGGRPRPMQACSRCRPRRPRGPPARRAAPRTARPRACPSAARRRPRSAGARRSWPRPQLARSARTAARSANRRRAIVGPEPP